MLYSADMYRRRPMTRHEDGYGEDMDSASDEQSSSCSSRQTDSRAILQEVRSEFDGIRFASYRCAAKLRFIQKRTNLHLIDIWNVIEAFRENGLNVLEPQTAVNSSRLDSLLTSLYLALNKRLPLQHQINLDAAVNTVLSFLITTYDVDDVGSVRVFSIKVAMATLCSGKITDKLRYVFSQISDGNGQLAPRRFCDYLREVQALPAAVFESPTFSYSDEAARLIFPAGNVNVNDFLERLLSEQGPECLAWLPLLHRMATVETVYHNVQCAACEKSGFTGFKYRCERCSSYQLCQDCFWRGQTSGAHTLQHPMKELITPKSPTGPLSRSFRGSFRCVPERREQPDLPRYPAHPEKTFNLMHIVPPSPLLSHNGPAGPPFLGATGSGSSPDSLPSERSMELDGYSPSRLSQMERQVDEEHRLIARYSARLAAEKSQNRTPSDTSSSDGRARSQRETIAQLEAKNQEIMRQIARLRAGAPSAAADVELVSELRALRQRRGELETHLSTLQDSRRQLMGQLDSLMKMLKSQQLSPVSGSMSLPRTSKSAPNTPGSTLRRAHRQQTAAAAAHLDPDTSALLDPFSPGEDPGWLGR
ncbi:dystrobrevin beta-like isoform X2 [Amphibalanus amphitrite]|uniref:dystrobrevin beta-like isoform X2 n=1 Tax=Amphibalanus amphitrite TaxID=1232801 RepID=UPI001C921EEC|nr:dystrobrevin beta-like isoform X2 [Amphibalanus amphitrite]